jgi:hypothetical protein
MTLAALVSLIVVLVVLGLILYLVETYIPMAAPFKLVIRVLVILGLCLYILRVFNLLAI